MLEPDAPEPGTDTPRRLADRYVDAMVALDPIAATGLGLPDGADRLPDFSPAGAGQESQLRRRTLAELDSLEATADGPLAPQERVCARLLRERLTAAEALYGAGEELRALDTLFAPLQMVRQVFTIMPTATAQDWRTVAARMSRVPRALDGYRESLAEGKHRGLLAGPRQVEAVHAQLGRWLDSEGQGRGWFTGLARTAAGLAPDGLDGAAEAADGALARLRDWLGDEYAPAAAERARDAVGEERYARLTRYWTGADLDLAEAYAWSWQEYARIVVQLSQEAERVLPGASPREAMEHLTRHGEAVHGEDDVLERLQAIMDGAIVALDGVHFDLAEPLRRVEAVIAPEGSAAAPYYSPPSLDFSRPGRTWLPTLGRDRFPLWDLVSTWYHEGVPGHHLQLGQWVLMAPQLSRFQTTLGSIGANLEGWALYAERLMDELGFFSDPGARMGYLDAQQMRTVRVIIDIGMHLELPIPADQGVPEPFHPGQRWTPQLGREFIGRNSGRPADFLDSEVVRYLGMPGQAISYKLGERAWLAGRDAAQRAAAGRGERFDARAWHMAALSQGSLGLDDLVTELALL